MDLSDSCNLVLTGLSATSRLIIANKDCSSLGPVAEDGGGRPMLLLPKLLLKLLLELSKLLLVPKLVSKA